MQGRPDKSNHNSKNTGRSENVISAKDNNDNEVGFALSSVYFRVNGSNYKSIGKVMSQGPSLTNRLTTEITNIE